MQSQTFTGHELRDNKAPEFVGSCEEVNDFHRELLKKEEAREIKRVELVFPEKRGIVTDGTFTPKYVSKTSPVDRINLSWLMEKLFIGGKYEILGIDPNVDFIISVYEGMGRLHPKLNGPKIRFYLEKENILTGELTVQMSKIDGREIYGEVAKIKKVGSKRAYEVNPWGLSGRQMSTQEALDYLKKELNLNF